VRGSTARSALARPEAGLQACALARRCRSMGRLQHVGARRPVPIWRRITNWDATCDRALSWFRARAGVGDGAVPIRVLVPSRRRPMLGRDDRGGPPPLMPRACGPGPPPPWARMWRIPAISSRSRKSDNLPNGARRQITLSYIGDTTVPRGPNYRGRQLIPPSITMGTAQAPDRIARVPFHRFQPPAPWCRPSRWERDRAYVVFGFVTPRVFSGPTAPWPNFGPRPHVVKEGWVTLFSCAAHHPPGTKKPNERFKNRRSRI